jgi:amidase/formamidase
MILNPDGTIICEAPLGLPWMIKADIYPQIVDQIRKEAVTSNFPWSFKNRGAAHPDFAGQGDGLDKYTTYR